MRAALLLSVLPSCSLLDLLPDPKTPNTDPIEVGAVAAPAAPAATPAHGAWHRADQDLEGTISLVVGAPDGSHGVVLFANEARSLAPDGSVRATRKTGHVVAATAGPGGTWALAEEGAVTLLDGSGSVLHTLPITALDIAWSPDGRYLAVATEDDLRIADVATGEKVAHYQPEYGGGNVWWHPDGRTLRRCAH